MSRREFLYEIDFWEARRIVKGYDRRHASMWSAIRWQTYCIMQTIPYTDLKKAGIYRPTDLIKFPWDMEAENEDLPSEDEVRELQELMASMNSEC